MNKDKESALKDYLEMIKRSWTWDRLTEKERKRFEGWIQKGKWLKGSYKQRWDTLENYYTMFLLGTGYDGPIGWREPEREKKENPRF